MAVVFKLRLSFIQFSASIVLVILSGVVQAQLNGNYTIDRKGTASDTVYLSIGDFISDLDYGKRSDYSVPNGPGVSGKVTANIRKGSGPYTEQIRITQIDGASNVNQITLNGSGETIEWKGTSFKPYCILLDSADYIHIDSFTIHSLHGSFCVGVQFSHLANFNTLSNCTISFPNLSLNNANVAYIEIGDSNYLFHSDWSNPGYGNKIIHNKLLGDSISNPKFAIRCMHLPDTSARSDNIIEGNHLNGWNGYGISIEQGAGYKIVGNNIENAVRKIGDYQYGIYLNNYKNRNSFYIAENYIHDFASRKNYYGPRWFGIQVSGGDAIAKEDLVLEDNRIILTNCLGQTKGIELLLQKSRGELGLVLRNNTIEISFLDQAEGAYGIKMECGSSGNVKRLSITENKVYITKTNSSIGLLFNADTLDQNPDDFRIINNVFNVQAFASGGAMNLRAVSSNKWYIKHNTLNVGDGNNHKDNLAYYGMLIFAENGELSNNILTMDPESSSGVNGFINGARSGNMAIYNNCLYLDNAKTNNLIYANWKGTVCWDFKSFNNLSSDRSNVNKYPEYIDPGSNNFIAISNFILNGGRNMPDVPFDTEQRPRDSLSPDIGAYETHYELILDTLFRPTDTYCLGDKDSISLRLINRSSCALKQVPFKIYWMGDTLSRILKQDIPPGDTVVCVLNLQIDLNRIGRFVLEIKLAYDEDSTNNRLARTIDVFGKPTGFKLVAGPGNQGILTNGKRADPDIGSPGYLMEYRVSPRYPYSNANYGIEWTSAPLVVDMLGDSIPGLDLLSKRPTKTSDATASFVPKTFLCDSLFRLWYEITDVAGCKDTIERWITLDCIGEPDFISTKACTGDTVHFLNTSDPVLPSDRVGYEWHFGDTAFADPGESTEINPIYTYLQPGIYQVKLIVRSVKHPSFSDSITKRVEVLSKPDVSFRVKNACSGEDLTFTNTTILNGNPDGLRFTWDFGDGSSSYVASPVHRYTADGIYQVVLTVENAHCIDSAAVEAAQYPVPIADFSWIKTCSNQPVQFINESWISSGLLGASWNFDNLLNSQLKDPFLLLPVQSDHKVTLAAISEYGCADSVTQSVVLDEAPLALIIDREVCVNDAVKFVSDGGVLGMNNTFRWVIDGMDTVWQREFDHEFQSTGEKKVELVIRSFNGCMDSAVGSLLVRENIVAAFTADNGCEGDTIRFANLTADDTLNVQYTWLFGDAQTSSLRAPSHAYTLINNRVAETFVVSLLAKLPNGCRDSVSGTVTIEPLPDPYFKVLVQGEKLIIDSQATTDPDYSYHWTFGNGIESNDVTPEYEYMWVDRNTYEVCLEITDVENCSATYCTEVDLLLSTGEFTWQRLSVYPNPVTNYFSLQMEGLELTGLRLYTWEGILVREFDPVDQVHHVTTMASGIYILGVESLTEVAFIPLIIVK